MRQILNGIRQSLTNARLRRRASVHPTPEAFLELGRSQEQAKRWAQASETARLGLQKFPYSRPLQEFLRSTWEQHWCVRTAELEARTRQDSDPVAFVELIELYLGHLKPDAGLAVAERMIQRHPDDSCARHASGQVYLSLFQRDHLARDGERAIAEFERAVELDPESFAPRLALADTWLQIGATSKAAIQICLALELDPGSAVALDLNRRILALPPENEDQRELLWSMEENDEAWVGERDFDMMNRKRDEIMLGVSELSRVRGVRRVVLCHRSIELTARRGATASAEEGAEEYLIDLARGFRRAASLALKRMGVGEFEEATVCLREGIVQIFSAGASVLLVTTDNPVWTANIADHAREALATWTGRLECGRNSRTRRPGVPAPR